MNNMDSVTEGVQESGDHSSRGSLVPQYVVINTGESTPGADWKDQLDNCGVESQRAGVVSRWRSC